MERKISDIGLKTGFLSAKGIFDLLIAGAVYSLFAGWLYAPYFDSFSRLQFIVPVQGAAGAMGMYLLIYHNNKDLWPSLLCGALFGFGSFALVLGTFHPSVGVLFAALPWSCLPGRIYKAGKSRWSKALSLLLLILPVVSVIAFFKLAAICRLFSLPIQERLGIGNIASFFLPLHIKWLSHFPVSIYHIGAVCFIWGFLHISPKERIKLAVLLVICAGLGVFRPILQVSPVIWMSFALIGICMTAARGLGEFHGGVKIAFLAGLTADIFICASVMCDRLW